MAIHFADNNPRVPSWSELNYFHLVSDPVSLNAPIHSIHCTLYWICWCSECVGSLRGRAPGVVEALLRPPDSSSTTGTVRVRCRKMLSSGKVSSRFQHWGGHTCHSRAFFNLFKFHSFRLGRCSTLRQSILDLGVAMSCRFDSLGRTCASMPLGGSGPLGRWKHGRQTGRCP